MKRLVQKHRELVDAIVSGKSHYEACIAVYPQRAKWTKSAAEISVSKVLRLPHVKAYYDEQMAKLNEEKAQAARDDALWSFRESVEGLKFVIKMAQKDAINVTKKNQGGGEYQRVMSSGTASSIVSAITALNKMCGFDGTRPDGNNANDITRAIALMYMDAFNSIEEDPEDFKAPNIADVPMGG